MATVRDVLARKGNAVVSIATDRSVLEAARLMNEQGIGGLVVVEEEELVGVFTERDVLRRVVAERRDPEQTKVRDVMTTNVITCSPGTSLEECRAVMTGKRVRHLPVTGPDGLVGIVTIGDLLAFEVAEGRDTITQLQHYVFDTRPV
ncbi:MAG: CBS domain-containing protein [Gemmatimonadaceae bacterium]